MTTTRTPAERWRARQGIAAIAEAARDVRAFLRAIQTSPSARADALAALGLLNFRLGLYAWVLPGPTLARGVRVARCFEERLVAFLGGMEAAR